MLFVFVLEKRARFVRESPVISENQLSLKEIPNEQASIEIMIFNV